MEIKQIYKTKPIGTLVTVNGWVRSNRDNGTIGFLAIHDGSCFETIQGVYKDMAEVSTLRTGDAITVTGLLIESQGKQPFEIQIKAIEVVNKAADDYPLQKNRMSVEKLREIAHLRGKTNLFMAVMRIRDALAQGVHRFFEDNNYLYTHTPIITGNDGEGAGESFTVTCRGDGNYEKDFFKKQASLTVTGQLHAEAYAQAFGKVYTFGPTFRAENSNTSRHAAEFWMIEPELAFAGIEEDMDLAEAMVKSVLGYALKKCPSEYAFLDKFVSKGLTERLNKIVTSEFKKLKYTEMIDILKDAMNKGVQFEETNIKFGTDFNSEHERYISEQVVGGPVFATHYPKEIKAFYMRQTKGDESTVDSFDLLVPGIGELIGGSARENDPDILVRRMGEMGVPEIELQWYIDLRRFGGAPSAGFGLGFERLVMFATGVENIRDTIPFPRTTKNLKF